MSKCACGYECRLPGEQEMLGRYGCAKTIEKKEGPFGSLTVVQCGRDQIPPTTAVEDDKDFADKFLAKYRKDGNNTKP